MMKGRDLRDYIRLSNLKFCTFRSKTKFAILNFLQRMVGLTIRHHYEFDDARRLYPARMCERLE